MNNSKHKAKRLSVALLIAVLAVSTSFASVMTGCGNKDESSSTAATVTSTASAAENTTVANDKSESELNTESSTQSSSSNSTANSSQTSEKSESNGSSDSSKAESKSESSKTFAGHSGFLQYKDSTSFTFSITVFPPHAGQLEGISFTPLFVRFSPICGMIIFAL